MCIPAAPVAPRAFGTLVLCTSSQWSQLLGTTLKLSSTQARQSYLILVFVWDKKIGLCEILFLVLVLQIVCDSCDLRLWSRADLSPDVYFKMGVTDGYDWDDSYNGYYSVSHSKIFIIFLSTYISWSLSVVNEMFKLQLLLQFIIIIDRINLIIFW